MTRAVLIMGVSLAALACGGSDTESDQSSTGGAAGSATATGSPGAMGNGTITGTIRFTGTPPANPAIDMQDEETCAAKHAGGATDPQVVVNDGNLANAFVYVREGLPSGATYTAPSTPVVIDQDGCLYTPRVIGVMAGQPVEIRNSDNLLHNVKSTPQENRSFNRSQPTSAVVLTQTFTSPEIMVPLECNVHSWMKGFVGVTAHPFHAVSGEDGTFTIGSLPPGTYTIEAWHEALGTRTATVTVPADGSVSTEITFAPAA
jgi:plastocyanin